MNANNEIMTIISNEGLVVAQPTAVATTLASLKHSQIEIQKKTRVSDFQQ